MTRDELIEIINNQVYIEDNYGSYHEIAGVRDAADAILAKLSEEQRVARQELYHLQQVGAA